MLRHLFGVILNIKSTFGKCKMLTLNLLFLLYMYAYFYMYSKHSTMPLQRHHLTKYHLLAHKTKQLPL